MQATQRDEPEVHSITGDPVFLPGTAPFSTAPISTISNPYADESALGGRPGSEVDRTIGAVRCLIVQVDSRIGYARRTLSELESTRSRLIDGLREVSHASS